MKKIVLYGDSNTYGYDPRGILDRRYPPEHRWPDLLKQSGKWDIRAYGLNGREIPHNAADYAYLDQVLMNTAPFDLFCILLGSNDLLYLMGTATDMSPVAERMDRLLSYLPDRSAIDGDASRILLLAPPPFQITEAYYAEHNRESERFAATYQSLAQKWGTRFADTGNWKIDIAYDGVHFSEQGHHTFAAEMDQLLSNIFE